MGFKIRNFPVPEAPVAGLLLGGMLQFIFRTMISERKRTAQLIGGTLIVLGAGISTWAASEAGRMDISSPERLITSGPYAYSRNPMYVGWSLIYLGVTAFFNSIWLIAMFPFVAIYIHLVDIPREEAFLESNFGWRYREYRKKVRRYL